MRSTPTKLISLYDKKILLLNFLFFIYILLDNNSLVLLLLLPSCAQAVRFVSAGCPGNAELSPLAVSYIDPCRCSLFSPRVHLPAGF